jgi:hypothetical protein
MCIGFMGRESIAHWKSIVNTIMNCRTACMGEGRGVWSRRGTSSCSESTLLHVASYI